MGGRVRWGLGWWAVLPVSLALLSACATSPGHGASPGEPAGTAAADTLVGVGELAELGDGTVAMVGRGTDGDSLAGVVSGRVIDFGDCWALAGADGQVQALVFEHGTAVSADGGALVTPDGAVVRPGDGVTAVGGNLSVEETGARAGWSSAPQDCWRSDTVARVTDGLRVDPSVVDAQRGAWGQTQELDDGTVLLVEGAPPTGGMDALATGALTRLDGGCLGLGGDGYGARQLVRWPYGTVWDPEGQVLTLPGGRAVRLGDVVELGGGQGVADWLSPALPTGCAYDSVWVASSPS